MADKWMRKYCRVPALAAGCVWTPAVLSRLRWMMESRYWSLPTLAGVRNIASRFARKMQSRCVGCCFLEIGLLGDGTLKPLKSAIVAVSGTTNATRQLMS